MSWLQGFEHVTTENEPLAPRTWLRVGGAAAFFAEPTSPDELQALVARCHESGNKACLLGGGSNLLIRDEGVGGLVLHLAAAPFCGIEVHQGERLKASGGAKLSHVISTAVREGLSGLEPLVGIPGTVGGAIHGNAYAHGGDVGQCVREATVMTRAGEIITRKAADLTFAHRQSSLDELVILDVTFELERDDPAELTRRMQKIWIGKKATQPPANQNAGRIFKSPAGIAAGELIEQAGLKGATCGAAVVSEHDANFIVAGQGATSADVLKLIEQMQSQVQDRLGVELELEIEVW
jgi:UDP-N-acetylmuramate dehydrogenase